jgi:hypothetical protein
VNEANHKNHTLQSNGLMVKLQWSKGESSSVSLTCYEYFNAPDGRHISMMCRFMIIKMSGIQTEYLLHRSPMVKQSLLVDHRQILCHVVIAETS